MKVRMKRVAATALALTMCVPSVAFASSTTPEINGEKTGSFNTSFDVYSPALHISVPLKADIEVNPMANSSSTGVKKFSVASNSIDIINASVDTEADAGIPVNVTIQATISSQNEDVTSEYNTFTADPQSTKKRIYLELSEAQTAAGIAVKANDAAAFDTDNLLDLSKYEVGTAAVYTTPAQSIPVTKYGSLLSMDIAEPTTTNTTTGATFTTAAADVTAKVGSFAVTGVANANADWKADDVAVAITYNVKASQALAITTPKIATAPTATGSAADVAITVPGVGESTVVAIAIHNDGAAYKDYMLEDCVIEYVANGSATDAKITIPKDHPTLVFLEDEANGCKGKAQDLVIGLSDGRRVVSTLTVN